LQKLGELLPTRYLDNQHDNQIENWVLFPVVPLHTLYPSSQEIASDNMSDVSINIPSNIVMFDRLDHEELSIVAKYMEYRDVEPGEYVFKEGEKGSYMCFVAEGALDILKKNVAGESVVISTLRTGESVGEMAVIDNYPRSANVRAKTKGILLTLSRYSFDTISKLNPEIGNKLLHGLCRLLCLHLRKTSKGFADHLSLQKPKDES
jgi:CRP-like cAMP-binding protein